MVKIKICGLCNREDYISAVRLGVDFTGFIFVPSSKRYIEPQVALEISESISGKNKKVGVFVNESINKIREIYNIAKLDIVQLHGEETVEFCEKLSLPYLKVIRVKDLESLNLMDNYQIDTFLLDTFKKDIYGGTGKAFDHDLLKYAVKKGKKIIVAGGVSEKNIENILKYSPFGVDINSSIETSPGIKDEYKMKNIISKIRDMEIKNGNG